MNNATREVFGNIAPWMQVVFFVMIAVSIGALVWQVMARVRLWRKGQPGGFERDWRVWIRRLMTYALAQKRVHKKVARRASSPAPLQRLRRADHRHHAPGDRSRWTLQLPSRLVLPDLRTDDGCLRRGLLPRLHSGHVSPRLSTAGEPRSQLARLVVAWDSARTRPHRFLRWKRCACITPRCSRRLRTGRSSAG